MVGVVFMMLELLMWYLYCGDLVVFIMDVMIWCVLVVRDLGGLDRFMVNVVGFLVKYFVVNLEDDL